MAIEFLVVYADAFSSFPEDISTDADGKIQMSRVAATLADVNTAYENHAVDRWFADLNVNDDSYVTWEEMIDYTEALCDSGEWQVALFWPESRFTQEERC